MKNEGPRDVSGIHKVLVTHLTPKKASRYFINTLRVSASQRSLVQSNVVKPYESGLVPSWSPRRVTGRMDTCGTYHVFSRAWGSHRGKAEIADAS